MATIQSLNPPASTIVVGREGEHVTLQITFSNGDRKSARVKVADVRALATGARLEVEGLRALRCYFRPTGRQRAIDVLRLFFAGDGPDLAIVSRATLLRAAKVRH